MNQKTVRHHVQDIERSASPEELEKLEALTHISEFDVESRKYLGAYCGARTGQFTGPDAYTTGKNVCQNCQMLWIAKNGVPHIVDYRE